MKLGKEYLMAFRELLPTMDVRKKEVLRAMMNAPSYTLSSNQLLRKLQVADNIVVNQAVGQLGGQLFKRIGKHPEGWPRETFQSWTMVAETGESLDEGFPWRLRPQVIAALETLGFVEPVRVEADEIPPEVPLMEGAKLQRWVNAYERNPHAREQCIAHYGCSCAVCDMNFGERYNNGMDGFIHVHHLKPLSEIDAEYEVDPIKDLRPVCPNCHAVLHFGGVLRSIKEAKLMIQKRSIYIASSGGRSGIDC